MVASPLGGSPDEVVRGDAPDLDRGDLDLPDSRRCVPMLWLHVTLASGVVAVGEKVWTICIA
jgi:hypothetical protein